MELKKRKNDPAHLLRKSLRAIEYLQQQVKNRQEVGNEPIAVVGMALRFPGNCRTPETFWKFLLEGGDGIVEIPENRWDATTYYDPSPSAPGKMYINQAGFLSEDVGEFDPRFFGISPREAVEMDPQQRLLLEVSYEAIENANIGSAGLKGRNVGTFIGISGSEYAKLPRKRSLDNPYIGTGTSASIASGRIAYILKLNGPALSIDTACSSSLVSVHQACKSLWQGECEMALAGGVSLMLSPFTMIGLCMMRALAKDGRSKVFDARSDGYGRGEGCGIVLLKPLGTARRDNDNILAVIRGAAVNQDGASGGMTVPNGVSQQKLMESALKNAGVGPDQVSYIEAHGTGTELGDPIEMRAISQVFCRNREKRNPLYVGAVKSNIGHLEVAAGIAGLIKAILCLKHRRIPPNLHLKTLNPKIELQKMNAVLPREPVSWDSMAGPRYCGVSSFGFSGTNAHVILAEAPEPQDSGSRSTRRPLHVLNISAKNDKALKDLAAAYLMRLEACRGGDITDLCYTANTCRNHFQNRVSFIADGKPVLKPLLAEYLNGAETEPAGRIHTGKPENNRRPRPAFLFRGDLKGCRGWIRQLLETQPVFSGAVGNCEQLFAKVLEGPLPEAPEHGRRAETDPHRSSLADEALIFSVQYGLARMWESWGVKPFAVYGEKTGVWAAAAAAGVLPLQSAVKFCLKTCLMIRDADAWPSSESCEGRIRLSGGGEPTPFKRADCRVVSSVTGLPAAAGELGDISYWRRQFFSPARFRKASRSIKDLGCEVVVEMNPGCFPREDEHPPGKEWGPWSYLMQTLSRLYCGGAEIDWVNFDKGNTRNKVVLPNYAFRRKRYWFEPAPEPGFGVPDLSGRADEPPARPLEGRCLKSPLSTVQFEYNIDTGTFPEVSDNRGVVHVGYYHELLCRAVRRQYGPELYGVREIDYLMMLYIPDAENRKIQLLLSEGPSREIRFRFHSLDEASDSWRLHAKGRIRGTDLPAPDTAPDLVAVRERCGARYGREDFYGMMAARGFKIKGSIKLIDEVFYREGETLAKIRNFPAPGPGFELPFHPGVLDACAQAYFSAFPGEGTDTSGRFMMTRWSDFQVASRDPEEAYWCHVVLSGHPGPDGSVKGAFTLLGESGRPVAACRATRMKALDEKKLKMLAGLSLKRPVDRSRKHGLITSLEEAPAPERKERLFQYLRQQLSSILDIPVSDINPNDALYDLGMDSIVGIELKTTIESHLDVEIPMDDLIQGPSVAGLADKISVLIPEIKSRAGEAGDTPAGENSPARTADGAGPDSWFLYRGNSRNPDMRLFCFPYGGTGASLFHAWHRYLPENIEVCPVQLPGRENRIKTPPLQGMSHAVDTLARVLAPDLDRPYAFFGHSMGALLAYALCRRLDETAGIKPSHLFVGGFSSPSIHPNPFLTTIIEKFRQAGFRGIPGVDEINALSVEHIRKFTRHGGKMNVSPEIVKVFLPMIISDIHLVESYRHEPVNGFDVPITAFHGKDDDRVAPDDIQAWKETTSGTFKAHTLKGDHFFLQEQQSQEPLLDLISRQLLSSRTKRTGKRIGPVPETQQAHRVDIHHHILPEAYVAKLSDLNITRSLGVKLPVWDVQKTLNVMERNGISAAVTSISAPGVYFGEIPLAVELARMVNDFGADLISRYPSRFGAFASLPLPDIDAALRELEYALDTLRLDGVVLMTHVDKWYLGDPRFNDLFDELNKRKALVYIHPEIPSGLDTKNFILPPHIIDVVHDTTRAAAQLIYSGIAETCPDIRFMLSHAGGTIPYLAWRLSMGEHLPEEAALLQAVAPKGIKTYLKRFYYDTALSASPHSLRSLTELVDPSHIVFGSDYPFARERLSMVCIENLRDYDGFDEKQLLDIERNNALTLFPRLTA